MRVGDGKVSSVADRVGRFASVLAVEEEDFEDLWRRNGGLAAASVEEEEKRRAFQRKGSMSEIDSFISSSQLRRLTTVLSLNMIT